MGQNHGILKHRRTKKYEICRPLHFILVKVIKYTILALQKVDFVVKCTVCHQYSANLNALKKIKYESLRMLAAMFQVGEQEIVAIYDPPHLLKGIRNNFRVNNMQFTVDNVKRTARWGRIIKLYKVDEGDFTTSMCYKLSDVNSYKDRFKKMKVKPAAQVFSHRVTTTMRWTVKHDMLR